MLDFLIFQLYGQMAAWGDIAVGEYRPSRDYPSKSAILGLVAAGLGIVRDDEDKQIVLSKALGFGVCVLAHGDILRDYHTSQVPPTKRKRSFATRRQEICCADELNTILSQRDYHTDCLYKVALWLSDNDVSFSLGKIKLALTHPRFCLYLGRKSCPLSLPLRPHIFSNVTLKQAFGSYKLDGMVARSVKQMEVCHYYWDGSLNEQQSGMQETTQRTSRDQVRSRRRWQFAERSEFHYLEEV